MLDQKEINYVNVNVETLNIHPQIQRPLRTGHAEKIAANWNEVAYNPLAVIEVMENGTYTVIDGQHRLKAAEIVGKDRLMCKVVVAETVEEMNRIFQTINSGVLQVSAMDSYTLNARNDLASDDSAAEAILKIYNLTVADNERTDGRYNIRCASALRDAFNMLRSEKFGTLAEMLEVAAEHGNTLDTATVKALAEIVRLYGDDRGWMDNLRYEIEDSFGSMKSQAKSRCVNHSLGSRPGILVDVIVSEVEGVDA